MRVLSSRLLPYIPIFPASRQHEFRKKHGRKSNFFSFSVGPISLTSTAGINLAMLADRSGSVFLHSFQPSWLQFACYSQKGKPQIRGRRDHSRDDCGRHPRLPLSTGWYRCETEIPIILWSCTGCPAILCSGWKNRVFRLLQAAWRYLFRGGMCPVNVARISPPCCLKIVLSRRIAL